MYLQMRGSKFEQMKSLYLLFPHPLQQPYLTLVRKKEEMNQLQAELKKVQDKIMKITENEAFSKVN